MTRAYAMIAAAVLAAGLGLTANFALRGGGSDPFAECRRSRIASGASAIGGPFTLVDGKGEKVTDTDVIVGPTLIYFGYTFCPDVCPLDSARNAEAVDLLQDAGVPAVPVFISIDPHRDTPEVVRDFAGAYHPRMIGLTGSTAEVAAAAKAYRVYFKANPSGDDYYLVDHTTLTYLVFPKAGSVDFFQREATPKEIADTIGCYVRNGAA